MVGNNRAAVALRRQKVWSLICRGTKRYAIANELQVSSKTISSDIKFMTKDSHNYLNDMAKEMLPFMYKISIEGLQDILLECWKMHHENHNPQWMRIAVEAHIQIFSQCANGVSVAAVKKVIERANSLGLGLEVNDGR
jgi:hypothetical protein